MTRQHRTRRRFALNLLFCALALAFAANTVGAQTFPIAPGPNCLQFGLTPDNFANVTHWVGSFTLTGSGSRTLDDGRGHIEQSDRFQQSASVRFTVPGLGYTPFIHSVGGGAVFDEGTLTASASTLHVAYYQGAPTHTRSENDFIGSAGAFILSMDGDCTTYELIGVISGSVTVVDSDDGTYPGPYVIGPLKVSLTGGKVPVTGTTLAGTSTFSAPDIDDVDGAWTTTWSIAPASVCTIQNVEWQGLDRPLDDDPLVPGGLRMFPDRGSLDEDEPDGRVNVVLTTSQTNCLVDLALFDIDDPASDAAPIDPNGPDGGDNSPPDEIVVVSEGAGSIVSAVAADPNAPIFVTRLIPDSANRAVLAVPLTRAAGDNFRVAASAEPDYLQSVRVQGQDLVDGHGVLLPSASARVSPPLTIWRHLLIERDHMAQVTTNHVEGTGFTIVHPGPGVAVVVVDQPLKTESYEGGTFYTGGRAFPVVANHGSMLTLGRPLTGITSGAYRLFDDDDFNNDDPIHRDGDEGELVADVALNWSFLLGLLAPAHVVPIELTGTGNPRPVIPFLLHWPPLSSTAAQLGALAFDSCRYNSPTTWVMNLVSAYQSFEFDPVSGLTIDGDPPITVGAGSETSEFGVTNTPYNVSIVFQESLSDHELASLRHLRPGGYTTAGTQYTAAHEIGHVLGLDDDPPTVPASIMAKSAYRTAAILQPRAIAQVKRLHALQPNCP